MSGLVHSGASASVPVEGGAAALFQLSASQTYGSDAGRWIVTSASGEREFTGPMMKADAEAYLGLLATLIFVSTDPCFSCLGSVTHDEVRAAIAKASGATA
jgi:hypothetical protein